MSKKILITFLLMAMFSLTICSYSLAATKAGDEMRDAGRSASNAATSATNSLANGAKDLVGGISNMGKDMMNSVNNANGDKESDATNTIGTTDGDYTATRTATGNNNFLGMSDNTWTWLILGIVGVAIAALVWYYSSQYEHRNYNND